MTRRARSEAGVVLVMVLIFVLLLAASIATFLRRVAIDSGVAQNRDAARQAEGRPRGGIRIAEAVLIEDLREKQDQPAPDTLEDVWARMDGVELSKEPDTSLTLVIRDAATRLDLNAVLVDGQVDEENRAFLESLLTSVIDEMPGRPEDKLYDPKKLAENLADWIDADDVRLEGGPEDEIYARRNPPVRVPNLPLMSVDDLRRVEGFDQPLVEALRPYVGVYPLAGGSGPNLNTAPSWVLAKLLTVDASERKPLSEEDVHRILKARASATICLEQSAPNCVSLTDVLGLGNGHLTPPPSDRSNVFFVRARARVLDVERTIDAVIDRSVPSQPARLSWRVQ
jgi:type II secretory pathway component PulK